MTFDKPAQDLTINNLHQWLTNRQTELRERAQHLRYDDSKRLDQRELMTVSELLMAVATLADACTLNGYLPFSLEDYVNDEDGTDREFHQVQHALLTEDLARCE
jgi:hypothetical protein